MSLSAKFILRLRNLTEAELVSLCFQMAEAHADTFEQLVMGLPDATERPITDRDQVLDYSGGVVNLTGAQMRDLRAIATPDKKVTMIKMVREFTGLGLKEAKDFVEEVFLRG